MTLEASDPKEAHRPFLPQVESLRGFAALCVAYAHCGLALAFSPDPSVTAWDKSVDGLLDVLGPVLNARTAVMIFFVISGLVLSMALDERRSARPIASWAGFLWRRALRIYPAHIVSILLFVPFAWLLFRHPVADPARLASVWVGQVPWVNGAAWYRIEPDHLFETAVLWDNFYNPVTWTLKVEMIGALFVPLFAFLSRRRLLAIDLALLALLAVAALLVDTKARPDLFPLYLPAFYLGCMARTLGRKLGASLRGSGWMRAAALILSYALLVGPSALFHASEASAWLTLWESAAAFLFVSLIAWSPAPKRRAILLHPAARWAGRLSYSFYLWHSLILFAFLRLLFALVDPDLLAGHKLAVLAVTLVATITGAFVAGYVSWRWIERPFMMLGHRRGRKARVARGPEGTPRPGWR
jgi:peptidoglycan/LPS O-acetylase OafA/YrhL